MADAVVAESKPASTGNNDMLVKAIVLWLLAPIGYLFYMNETDPFVKFYAKQSLYYGIAVVIAWVVVGMLSFIGIGLCLMPIVGIAQFIIMIFMVMKMNSGVKVKLPVIGDMAEKA